MGLVWLACAARAGADAPHLRGAAHLLTLKLVANVTLTPPSIEAIAAFVWRACAARAGADAQQLAVAGHLLTLKLMANATLTTPSIEAVTGLVWLACADRAGADTPHLRRATTTSLCQCDTPAPHGRAALRAGRGVLPSALPLDTR